MLTKNELSPNAANSSPSDLGIRDSFERAHDEFQPQHSTGSPATSLAIAGQASALLSCNNLEGGPVYSPSLQQSAAGGRMICAAETGPNPTQPLHTSQCNSSQVNHRSSGNERVDEPPSDSNGPSVLTQRDRGDLSSTRAQSPTLDTASGSPASAHLAEAQADDCVTIIHFNDCYNVEPGPESSGAAGFLSAVNQFRHLNPIILFSGDIISPSFMSTFTKGEQMIPVLNDIGVHCAVFGNHEFDYGVDNLIDFTKRTNFPWLLSNVVDKETSDQLGDGRVFHIIEHAGLKLAIIGLIEEEWLSTLSTLDSSDVIYEDFVVKGRELARELKQEPHNADYVIALTHFRTPNDIRLADSVPEIDLILGGHDHDYEIIKRPNSYIIKSGTDFREFSLIKLKLDAEYMSERRRRRQDQQQPQQQQKQQHQNQQPACLGGLGGPMGTDSEIEFRSGHDKLTDARRRAVRGGGPFVDINIERVECVSFPPEANLKAKLDKFVSTIDEKMGKVLGQFNCELDGRFSSIRKRETNLGNFVTDIMLASTHADLAILNSGTLRSDRIHPVGDFTMRDLFNILGYIDPIAVLSANGRQILRALENGVSQWPRLEGRFPQVSGCSFVFDPTKPPLNRIDPNDVTIGDEPLDLDKFYKLTTKAYLASGKDGYDVLKECEVLVPGDESPDLTTSILNHFEAINIIKSNRRTHHRQSIICLSRSSIKRILDESAGGEADDPRPRTTINENNLNKSNNNDDNNNIDHLREESRTCSHEVETKPRLLVADAESKHPVHDNHYHDNDNCHCEHCATRLLKRNRLPDVVEDSTPTHGNRANSDSDVPSSSVQRQAHQPRTKRMMSLYEMEHEQCKLEPKVEGRIRILGYNYERP